MPDPTNNIDALIDYLDAQCLPGYRIALTALVAERDELKEMHAHLCQSYTMLAKECDALKQRVAELESHKSVSVRLLLAERDGLRAKIADAYRDRASSKSVPAGVIAERNALKQRVAELESHSPADRDRELRERLDTTLAWMAHVTDMLIRLPHTDHARIELENRLDRAVNAAMRKGEA